MTPRRVIMLTVVMGHLTGDQAKGRHDLGDALSLMIDEPARSTV